MTDHPFLGPTQEEADVYGFNLKFGVPMAPVPCLLDPAATAYRVKFLREELTEFEEAVQADDLEKAADALVDLAYVAIGTALMMGLPWSALWAEVQRANMTKVRASSADESKRGSPLDVVKPEGWLPPDHSIAIGTDAPKMFCTTCRSVGFEPHTTGCSFCSGDFSGARP